MSRIFHRQPRHDYPVAVRGEGIEIIDQAGRHYIDASGGAAVSSLGHSHPRVIEAIEAQLEQLAYAHTAFFTNEPAERLADRLVEAAPDGIGRVFYVSGGSEATEAALKMARQYFVEIGQPERRHFIARWQSYHGNTLGALAVGGNRWRRTQFEPLLIDVAHVSPCYAYRGKGQGESDQAYGERLAAELEAEIRRLGPETVIGFVAEPVVGATMGAVPAVEGYLKAVRELCDRHGILLILDEVMCGMGRTGTLFACEQDGVAPDLVTIAKGLGAGYQPIGAVLVAEKIHRAIVDGSGFFQHGHTYMGHPTACAGALAVQETIAEEQLLDSVRQQGTRLFELLAGSFGDHPHVGDVRGRGLFLGLELVADRATKEPFPPEHKLNARIKAAAMARGLMCYPMGGTIDGRRGDHVLLAPPFIVTDAQLKRSRPACPKPSMPRSQRSDRPQHKLADRHGRAGYGCKHCGADGGGSRFGLYDGRVASSNAAIARPSRRGRAAARPAARRHRHHPDFHATRRYTPLVAGVQAVSLLGAGGVILSSRI